MMEIQKRLNVYVPLKHLSNCWKTLDMSLTNCEVSLTLTWSKNCVITDETTQDADPNYIPPLLEIRAPTGAIFEITNTKLYLPVVTLPTEDDNKLLEQLRAGFKRTIKTNNLNYLIDPTFNKVNRLFVLSFENEEDRKSFSKYYTSIVAIKDVNVLIDGKRIFDVPIKNKEEPYKKIIEMSKSNDYTTGNLLDYDNFSKHYKLIAIDLSKQIELENSDLK